MFHCFQDIMHQFKGYDTDTLTTILNKSFPVKCGVTSLPELKRQYWFYADLCEEQLQSMRSLACNYYQSRSDIDYEIMRRAEDDYAEQLDRLKSFSVFYACHHYLGTEGFQSVSLD